VWWRVFEWVRDYRAAGFEFYRCTGDFFVGCAVDGSAGYYYDVSSP
jgi:hypothetical protein